jgi:hypothetical protein
MAVSAEELGTEEKTPHKTGCSSFYWDFIHVRQYTSRYYICGQWIGSLAIAAVTVVLPITFFISSLEWLGIGGGSVL